MTSITSSVSERSMRRRTANKPIFIEGSAGGLRQRGTIPPTPEL
jgi:hypothetical protein